MFVLLSGDNFLVIRSICHHCLIRCEWLCGFHTEDGEAFVQICVEAPLPSLSKPTMCDSRGDIFAWSG